MLDEKNYENKKLLLILVIPITILAKVIQFYALPDKYFWDSSRINGMVTGLGKMKEWEGSYEVTADFFKMINIFNFTSINDWAIFLAVIFSIVLIIMLAKVKEFDTFQSIFILASIGLLNIYIFNISKDIIQFAIFLLMYIVVVNKNINSIVKVILCLGIFIWESTFFRSYYIIMGILSVVLYFLFNRYKSKAEKISKGTVIKILVAVFLTVYVFLFLAQFVASKEYDKLITVRDANANEVAVSQIENWVESDGTLNNYMINYLINGVRMMLPIELLTNGVFYIPFTVYQIFILFYLIKSIRGINKESSLILIMSISIFCAYLLGSFMFEPDFGSFVRHEAATFPILHLMVCDKSNMIFKDKEESLEISKSGGNI